MKKNRFIQGMIYLLLIYAADTILSLVFRLIGWALRWFHISWVTVLVGGVLILGLQFVILCFAFYAAMDEDFDD